MEIPQPTLQYVSESPAWLRRHLRFPLIQHRPVTSQVRNSVTPTSAPSSPAPTRASRVLIRPIPWECHHSQLGGITPTLPASREFPLRRSITYSCGARREPNWSWAYPQPIPIPLQDAPNPHSLRTSSSSTALGTPASAPGLSRPRGLARGAARRNDLQAAACALHRSRHIFPIRIVYPDDR